jgi:hypothetical protein
LISFVFYANAVFEVRKTPPFFGVCKTPPFWLSYKKDAGERKKDAK